MFVKIFSFILYDFGILIKIETYFKTYIYLDFLLGKVSSLQHAVIIKLS